MKLNEIKSESEEDYLIKLTSQMRSSPITGLRSRIPGNKKSFTKNEDGSYDVSATIDYRFKKEQNISVKLNLVDADFRIVSNDITSFKNFPREVSGSFLVVSDKITSLVDGPREVGIDYSVRCKSLKSFNGMAKRVGKNVLINGGVFENFIGLPKEIFGNLVVYYSPVLKSLEGFPAKVHGEVVILPFNPKDEPKFNNDDIKHVCDAGEKITTSWADHR